MMKVCLMYPDHDFMLDEACLPPNKDDLEQDLELGILFDAMAKDDSFLRQVARQAVLSSLKDPAIIHFRQEILKDCLNHPETIQNIYRIPLEFLDRKRSQWLWISTRHANPSSILSSALHMLEASLDLIRSLRQIADREGNKFESAGFRRLFTMFQTELNDDYLSRVQETLQRLKFPNGALVSAKLGPGNEGTGYLLCKPNHTGWRWVPHMFTKKSPEYTLTLHPRDDHGARALAELKDRGIARAAEAVARAAGHIENFFQTLRVELAFYLCCLNLHERLLALGEPISLPKPLSMDQREIVGSRLYDITLALTLGRKVVDNSIHIKQKDLCIITGPNQGGKTTFLRSVGVAQLMAQSGMFVPAQSYSASLCTALFTHFKREEDKTMESGKFAEELRRISRIIDLMEPGALVLLNESFAATNEREGSEVARQIVRALIEKGIRVFFVTHLYEFAHGFYRDGMKNVLFLRAERLNDQRRTYKLVEGKPLATSFGVDLYQKIFHKDLHREVSSASTAPLSSGGKG